MNRRELLKNFGWNDDLIDFFMVTEDDTSEQIDDIVFTFDEEDTSKLMLNSSYTSNIIMISQ